MPTLKTRIRERLAPSVDPFRLQEKAGTEGDEARNIAARLRAFPTDEGNIHYLRKLIYEDSATLVAMIPAVEAAAGAESEVTRNFYQAASIVGSVGECSGNTQMWPLVAMAADAIDAALEAVDPGGEGGEGGEGGGGPLPLPPAAEAQPLVMQDGAVLRCSTGTWKNGPTLFGYAWRRDGLELGVGEPIYPLTAVAVGHAFDCVVTATNAVGSAASASNVHTVVPFQAG